MDRDLVYQHWWQHSCISNWSWRKWHDPVKQSWTMQYHVCHCFRCTKEHSFHQGIDYKVLLPQSWHRQSWSNQISGMHNCRISWKEGAFIISRLLQTTRSICHTLLFPAKTTRMWGIPMLLQRNGDCRTFSSIFQRTAWSINSLEVLSDGYVHDRYDCHVMLYGDGSFATGGHGEQSVPLKYIKKRCTPFFWMSWRKWIQDISDLSWLQKKSTAGCWEGCSWQGTNYRQRIEMVSFQWLSQELSQKSWLCRSKEYHVPWTWKWYWQSPIQSECAQMAKIHSRQSPFHTHSLIIPWDMIFVSMHAKENRM